MNMVSGPILPSPLSLHIWSLYCGMRSKNWLERHVEFIHYFLTPFFVFPFDLYPSVDSLTPPLHVVVLFPYFVRCSPGTGRSFCLACSVQTFSWRFVVLSMPALAWRCEDVCTRSRATLRRVGTMLLLDPWLVVAEPGGTQWLKTPFLWSEWQQMSTAVCTVLY